MNTLLGMLLKIIKYLISLINDYSLFGSTDSEIIHMISEKIGKKISETLFYRLKKESKIKRGEANEWIDYLIYEYYRKRVEEEVELVQYQKLLK